MPTLVKVEKITREKKWDRKKGYITSPVMYKVSHPDGHDYGYIGVTSQAAFADFIRGRQVCYGDAAEYVLPSEHNSSDRAILTERKAA